MFKIFKKKNYEFSADEARTLSSIGQKTYDELCRIAYMKRRDNLLSHIFDAIRTSARLGSQSVNIEKITYQGEDIWKYATQKDLFDILKYDTEYFEKLGYQIKGYKLNGRSLYYGLTVSWED